MSAQSSVPCPDIGLGVLQQTERAAIAAGPWFSALSPMLRHDILRRARVRRFHDKEVICCQGHPATNWMAVASGSVRLALNANGHEMTICYLEPGNWFGDDVVLSDGRYAHDAYAVGETTVLCLGAANVERILADQTELYRAVLQLRTQRLRQMTDLFAELATLPVRVRLAKHLARLARSFGERTSGSETLIQLDFQQKELGTLVGASRQRVNGALRDLMRSKLIRIEARKVVVRDAKALQLHAEELT